MPRLPRSTPARHLAMPLMVSASLGAAAVHAAVVPAHADWQPAAMFFAGLAMFQLCWAVLLLVQPPTRAFLALGISVNAGTIALWLGSRTLGMPFGPHRGEAEAFARTDVLAAGLEVALVGAALWWAGARTGARPQRPVRHFRVATGATGALVSMVAIVALGGASEHHHAPPDHTATTHLADGHSR